MDVRLVDANELERLLRSVVRDELDARERPLEIMTKKQLSERYGWSPSTINRKMKQGLPYFGKNGEHPRFRKSDVDSWLTSQQEYI